MGTARRWGGTASRSARAYLQPFVDAGCNCGRCGLPILPGQKWQAGHIIDYALVGNSLGFSNLRPEHQYCNQRAGGRQGGLNKAAKQGKKNKKIMKMKPASERGIRGI